MEVEGDVGAARDSAGAADAAPGTRTSGPATITEQGGAGSIRHKDQDRVVTVSANAAEGYLPAKLLAQVQEKVSEIEVPAGYSVRYTGENEEQAAAAEFLGFALLAALFLILLILVTEFNSIVQPMIILFSVVLSLIGVLWSLMIYREPFGIIMTGIGIISLAGVVVNNAIVMIDYTNLLRRGGMERREALLMAGLVRFRPVMLTAVTTVLGLVPLVIGVSIDFVNFEVVVGGRSVDMWGPMARVVSSGLVVATVLTLIVVPVLYSLLDAASERVQRLVFRKGAAAAAVLLVCALPWSARAQEAPADAAGPTTAEDSAEFSRPEDVVETDGLRAEEITLQSLGLVADNPLTLQDALRVVKSSSLDIEQARTQIAAADAQIRQAWSTIIPTVTLGGQYVINQREIVADFGGGMPLPPGVEAEPLVIQNKTDYRYSVAASVGANPRAIPILEGAKLQREIAAQSLEVISQSLERAVIETYYGLLAARALMVLSAEQLASSQTMLNATQIRVDAGTVNLFELTRAKLRVLQAEKELERARLQFIQLRTALADLLSIPANFDVVDPPNPGAPGGLPELKKVAREQREDVELAQMQTQLAELYVREVQFRYLPSLSATASYGAGKATAFAPSEPLWTITLAANWVLWDGGAREAETRLMKARQASREIEAAQLAKSIGTDLDNAYADYLSSLNQIESGLTQVALAEQALRQARIAYKYGAATQLDLINAEDEVKFAKIALIQDQLAVELAVRVIRNLTGES